MKKIIKKIKSNSLFTFILGGLIFGSIGIYGANNYQSNTIEYSPTDENWEVSNVNEAINSLYSMKEELENIKSIGDATATQILSGKKAVVKGSAVTGTMTNFDNQHLWVNGDNGTFYDNITHTYSNGKVTNEMVAFKSNVSGYFTKNTRFLIAEKNQLAPLIKSGSKLLGVTGTYTSDATATAADILSGKTAYVNGLKITGTIKDNGAVTKKIVGGGSYKIPSGYHNGSGVVNVSHTIKSWCPNYSPWNSHTSMYTTDTYNVPTKSLYILVIAENGGTVYQQGAPTCTDGTVTLIVNSSAGLLYKVDKTEAATFTLTIGLSRNYSSYPNSTLKVYAFTNS